MSDRKTTIEIELEDVTEEEERTLRERAGMDGQGGHNG
jgi:hypothetical protein